MKRKFDTQKITLMAMFLALIISVELLEGQLLRMPQGGSISIAPVIFISALLFFTFSESTILFVLWRVVIVMLIPPTIYSSLQFFLDYFIAYSGFLFVKLLLIDQQNLTRFTIAIILAHVVRYAVHVITGVIYFGEYADGPVLQYSLIYNLTYILPSLLAESIIGIPLYPMIKNKIIPKR